MQRWVEPMGNEVVKAWGDEGGDWEQELTRLFPVEVIEWEALVLQAQASSEQELCRWVGQVCCAVLGWARLVTLGSGNRR